MLLLLLFRNYRALTFARRGLAFGSLIYFVSPRSDAFYPAANASDVGNSPMVGEWALPLCEEQSVCAVEILQPAAYLFTFSLGAVVSLGTCSAAEGEYFENGG